MKQIKETLTCPSCKHQNDFEKYDNNEELYFYCGECDYLIKTNIPILALIREFFLFIINSIVLLSIPLLSLYFYEKYNVWDNYLPFIFLFSASIISVAYHEFFHAITAYFLGDDSVFGQRYLRLNIIKYFHGFNSFLVPSLWFLLTGIFLPGAAVYTDDSKLKTRFHLALVYAAGVMANLCILLIIIYCLKHFRVMLSEESQILLHTLAYIQVANILLNLLPIPPLDGWGIVSQILNRTLYNLIQKVSFIIFLGVLALAIYYDLFSYLVPIFIYSTEYFDLSSDYILDGWDHLILYDTEELKNILINLLKKFDINING